MPIKTVKMTHPETKATIQAPESGVKIHERSGWKVAPEKDADAATTDSAAPGPVPAGDTSKSVDDGDPKPRAAAKK